MKITSQKLRAKTRPLWVRLILHYMEENFLGLIKGIYENPQLASFINYISIELL
jgi:hypothetical protein